MTPSIYYMGNRRTEDIVHLQLTRQRAQQAEGEHGGGRQDDKLPSADGYQQSRPSGKQRVVDSIK